MKRTLETGHAGYGRSPNDLPVQAKNPVVHSAGGRGVAKRPTYLILAGLMCLFAGNTWALNNDAPSPDRNYRVIVERNPFGLKPPPPPPTNTPVVTAPKDEILLTGIAFPGVLRAYFMTKAPQGKTPEYFCLDVGQSKNGLDVLDIDPVAKTVRTRLAGVETVMSFAANGVKGPAGATNAPLGTPSAPGTLPTPGGGINPPTQHAGVPPGLPGYTGNTPANPPALGTTAGSTVSGVTSASNSRLRTIPSRNLRTPAMNAGGDGGVTPRGDPNQAVQDVLLMELQKRAAPNVPFPPTPMPP